LYMKVYQRKSSMALQILLLMSMIFPAMPQSLDARTPNDELVRSQKHLQQIKAHQAWDIVNNNIGIKIGVIDSGVDRDHPDLKDNLLPTINYVSSESPEDLNGHGTKVAGILAAKGNNKLGVSGVMWRARILPIKVLSKDGRQDDVNVLARAIRRAVSEGCKVILMSVSYLYSDPDLESAVAYAESHGVVVVAASGNEGNRVDYPAAYPTVIAVGAVGADNRRMSKSNFGPELDIVAPGYNIYSTSLNGKYGQITGTSAAAPQVAAAAALVLARNPKLTPIEVRAMLYENAADLGADGWDKYYGYGLLDVYRTVRDKSSPDIYESNNSQSRAAAFPIESQVRAQLSSGDSVDWYYTDLDYDGRLVYNTRVSAPGKSTLAATFYVEGRQPVTYYIGNAETLTVPAKEGRVYIKIQRVGDIGTVNYTLSNRFYINPDRYERNNTKETAYPLPIGNHSRITGNFHAQGDYDWYSYRFSENGMLSLTVSVDTLRIDPSILIMKQGSSGRPWEFNNGWPKSPTEHVADFPITPGKYYFKVKNDDEQPVNGQYYLDFTYTPERKDHNEPNNSYQSATRLGNSTLLTGTLATKHDYDWFSFQVAKESYVTIHAPYIPVNSGVSLALYKSSSVSSPVETEKLVAQLSKRNIPLIGRKLTPGTYYVRLNSSIPFKYETYRLTLTREALYFGYRDIQKHWARGQIVRLTNKGIVQGFGDYSFRPDAGVTRAQFAAMLMRAMKASGLSTGSVPRSNPFRDLKRSHWAYTSMMQAYSLGILQGYSNKSISPDKVLTRAEMATMIARAKKLPLAKRKYTHFRDVRAKHWAAPAIEMLYSLDWLNGYPNGTFRPDNYVRRGELTVVLAKAYRL